MAERPTSQRDDDRTRGLSPVAIGVGLLAAAGLFALLGHVLGLMEVPR
jgi:hypothetical protein